MGLPKFLQRHGKQVLGLVLTATFLTTIFAYGTGGYRAVRGEPLFFTPEMISTHLESYNEEEKEEIAKDLELARSAYFASEKMGKNVSPKPFYLATAGAPCSRKSTILERFVKAHPEYAQAVYLDQQTLKKGEKWRGASNYISLTLLEEAFAKKDNIVFGTILKSDQMKKLQKAGYQTALLLCSCKDEIQQSAESDCFAYADTLYVYWEDDLAAVLENGKISVNDQAALDRFVDQYEKDRIALEKNLPAWNELIKTYQARF